MLVGVGVSYLRVKFLLVGGAVSCLGSKVYTGGWRREIPELDSMLVGGAVSWLEEESPCWWVKQWFK